MHIGSMSRRWRVATVLLAVAGGASAATPLAAQSVTSVVGRIIGEDGGGLSGVRIVVEPGSLGSISDPRGMFRIAGVPVGSVTVSATRLGYLRAEKVVEVVAGAESRVEITMHEDALTLGGIVVSVSREEQRLAATPASVGVVAGARLRETGMSHPSEVMRQIPGAWVNVTAGEGHQTAIRQPLTTSPVYLYLEDGVPTRSTGFFNHNALYEVNIPQADRVEVTKGPVTALYGSDAIGGIVNVGTRAPTLDRRFEIGAEGGSFGWQRLLASASGTLGGHGLRAELNVTRSDGWRDATAYDRQSGTVRWDGALGTGSLRTVATFSNIDQNTAGSSALAEADYLSNPTRNNTPISFRKVRAFRLTSEYALARGNTLLTLTPFARWNEMDLLANWSLTYDPTLATTGHRSVGFLAKVRRDFEPFDARAILGVDVDYSPGFREEYFIRPERSSGIFTGYTPDRLVYDYDVTYRAASPYLQAEASPVDRVRLVAGLRLDMMGFDYQTRLDPIQADSVRHKRPESGAVDYIHLSPKLGATVEISEEVNLFVNYGHGFRAPSEGQLFRQGQALNTIGLKPVKVDSYEGGVRGSLWNRVRYDASVYHMTKTDDILSFVNPDGSTENLNAGETLHRGVEMGLGVELVGGVRADAAYSRAKHTYEVWKPRATVDLGGKEIETAPRTLATAAISYEPTVLPRARLSVEWTRVGSYWMDAQNTTRYPGHDLIGLRAAVPLPGGWSLYGRLTNVTDERYAETAAYTTARGSEYSPGMPRTLYLGLQRN